MGSIRYAYLNIVKVDKESSHHFSLFRQDDSPRGRRPSLKVRKSDFAKRLFFCLFTFTLCTCTLLLKMWLIGGMEGVLVIDNVQ